MTFTNLALGEFLALLLPLAAVVIVLYLYDRSRKQRVVSTLRFWPPEAKRQRSIRRKKIRQPLSFVLQLLALLLLVLAIADPRFRGDEPPRHHVVLLDASAWMRATSGASGGTLMDAARQAALAYLRAVPLHDPVMVVRADGNPGSLTGFTVDRRHLAQVIRDVDPGWTALDLQAAVELAADALELAVGDLSRADGSAALGEVAYIGDGRLAGDAVGPLDTRRLPFFRYISVGEEIADRGIRSLAARRTPHDPTGWEVSVELINNDVEEHTLQSEFRFANRRLTAQEIRLPAGGSREISFLLRAQSAGPLEVVLHPADPFPANDYARINIPAFTPKRVSVYSEQPSALGALLTASPQLQPEFYQPKHYDVDRQRGDLTVFDRFVPRQLPQGDAVFFDPPRRDSPITVSRVARNARISNWSSSHPLAKGLRNRDVILSRTSIFEPEPDDERIAECAAGPVIVARSVEGSRQVFFGFHPVRAGLEKHLATPLLFANALAWLLPDTFRVTQVVARPPGLVDLPLAEADEETIRFESSGDPALTWVVSQGHLRFYTAQPGAVAVRTSSGESHFALTLPEAAADQWSPPPGILRGVPTPPAVDLRHAALWPWLAAIALLALGFEWSIFGRRSPAQSSARGDGAPRGTQTVQLDLSQTDRDRAPHKEAVR